MNSESEIRASLETATITAVKVELEMIFERKTKFSRDRVLYS